MDWEDTQPLTVESAKDDIQLITRFEECRECLSRLRNGPAGLRGKMQQRKREGYCSSPQRLQMAAT
jgi:hypothetical protein